MFVNIIQCLGVLLSVYPNDINLINKAADAALELEELLLKVQHARRARLLVNAEAYEWLQQAMRELRFELSGKDEFSPEWHGKQLFQPASFMIEMTLHIIFQHNADHNGHSEEMFQMYAESLRYRISKLNTAWQNKQMEEAGLQ